MPAPKLMGSPFLVNTTTRFDQEEVKLHALRDGSFIAVWEDLSETGGDTSGSAIRAQIFNADGTKRGGEFLVNSTTENSQTYPSVTTLNDGRFVVAWHSDDGSGYKIFARAYQADGTAIGSEFQITSPAYVSSSDTMIVGLPDGGFAVEFLKTDGNVIIQTYNSSLQATGSPIEIVRPQNASIYDISITALQGRYSITYRQWDNGKYSVQHQVYNNDGSKVSSNELTSAESSEPITDVASTSLANGSVVVTWQKEYTNAEGKWVEAIAARILNPDGSPQGPEFVIQSGMDQQIGGAEVIQLADGGFAIAYFQKDNDKNSSNLYLAVYNSQGVKVAPETLVTKVFDPDGISLAALADGRVIVSWEEYYNTADDSNEGIFAQIVDVRQAAANLSGSVANDHYVGTDFNDMLAGAAGADKLQGEAGNDKLYGGADNDLLTGGAGKDIFVFNTALGTSKTDRQVNFDTITDFSVKDDSFWLDNAIFKKLGKKGTEAKPAKLNKEFFTIGTKAKEKDDYLVYNKKTGVLSYDADGSGKGKAIEIAQLSKNLKLTYKDFFVI